MKIGLVLPLAEYPSGQPSYAEIRALALQAEGAGFDSVWVFDHLLFRAADGTSEGIWESWTVLSALAEATDRVELGTLVLCTAFRNPAVLAKMAVTLDEVSGGRLILGLGCGWHKPEFDAFGVPFDHRVERFEEALRIVSSLLRTGRAEMTGRHYRVSGGELRPLGPRAGGPPLLVGAHRPRMTALAARYADLWNSCWFGSPEGAPDALARIREACGREGRDPASLGLTLGVNVVVDVAADGKNEPRGPAPAGTDVLSGSPEAVARGLRRYESLGVAHLILNLNPHDSAAQRSLATAVRLYRAGARSPAAEVKQ
ncbi:MULTISPECIES: LLM class flavin-dependent oxidoreductase [Streptomyces]|uniref:LLM class F420-dependent oxidoreductase n=2 Tax=Streptomyces TaxID=1883 RepID=A0A2U9P8Y6_STRAS|nr:LLM class flavin-dependent oxidoreductase [Streptomyces actuosus]AWT45664.1 LLM class F420-dependent oxidoreductase [Streptomyces actuosus]MBM4822295.1 LLM class flavin-dependent oxidoreductase [Streptomyces actuosus]